MANKIYNDWSVSTILYGSHKPQHQKSTTSSETARCAAQDARPQEILEAHFPSRQKRLCAARMNDRGARGRVEGPIYLYFDSKEAVFSPGPRSAGEADTRFTIRPASSGPVAPAIAETLRERHFISTSTRVLPRSSSPRPAFSGPGAHLSPRVIENGLALFAGLLRREWRLANSYLHSHAARLWHRAVLLGRSGAPLSRSSFRTRRLWPD